MNEPQSLIQSNIQLEHSGFAWKQGIVLYGCQVLWSADGPSHDQVLDKCS